MVRTEFADDSGQTLARELARELAMEQGARRAAEVAEHTARFLAEAASVLNSSLDYDERLSSLCRLLVPALGDYSLIDLVEESGSIRRVQTAHASPALEPVARELLRHAPLRDTPGGVPWVLRTGEPLLVEGINDVVLRELAQDDDHLDVLRRLAPVCFLCVPLQARGRTLGAITIARCDPARPVGRDDVALATDLAARAALALDNARLHRIAEQASRAKSAFLSMMSHELRTPLSAVLAYAELLQSDTVDPLTGPQREHAGRIADGARHVLSIIEEFLSYSRIESGEMRIERRTVDARSVVREAAAVVEPLAARSGLGIVLRLPPVPAPLTTDPGKLRQVLVNLLSNAVKYTDTGSVELSMETDGGAVVFDVTDTGLGITPEHLERIFDPYWQVHPDERAASGSGLGLAIVARLVELLGGTVSVRSTPGVGSVFSVRLPA